MANGQSLHIQLKSCRYQEMNAGDVQYSNIVFALVPCPSAVGLAQALFLSFSLCVLAMWTYSCGFRSCYCCCCCCNQMDNSNNNFKKKEKKTQNYFPEIINLPFLSFADWCAYRLKHWISFKTKRYTLPQKKLTKKYKTQTNHTHTHAHKRCLAKLFDQWLLPVDCTTFPYITFD